MSSTVGDVVEVVTAPLTRSVRTGGTRAAVEPPSFGVQAAPDGGQSVGRACALIDVALHHAQLRESFRGARRVTRTPTVTSGLPTTGPAEPELDPAAWMLAEALHPVAAREEDQAELETSRRAASALAPAEGARDQAPATDVGPLVETLGLPAATLERAALGLAADLVDVAWRVGIDLEARTPMARPEMIVPYDPEFLGDGFDVPLPQLGDALSAAALRGGEVIDYTHYSLVMQQPRRVAVYTAHNVDAAHMVRVNDRHPWRMDERIGEFQLGP